MFSHEVFGPPWFMLMQMHVQSQLRLRQLAQQKQLVFRIFFRAQPRQFAALEVLQSKEPPQLKDLCSNTQCLMAIIVWMVGGPLSQDDSTSVLDHFWQGCLQEFVQTNGPTWDLSRCCHVVNSSLWNRLSFSWSLRSNYLPGALACLV